MSEKVEKSAWNEWLWMELTGTRKFLDSMKIQKYNPSGAVRTANEWKSGRERQRSGWLRMELTGTPQFLDSMKIRNCNPSGENRQWVKKWKRAPEVGDYGWNWLELESTLASAAAETHVHSAHAQRTVALTTGETSPHPVHYARNQTTRRCKFQDKTFAKSSTY